MELMKLFVEIDSWDTSLDKLLNFFISKAKGIILGYCNTDALDEAYDCVIAQYAVYLYKNRDSEGLMQKTEGEKSVTFEGAIPKSISLQLPLPRIKAVGYVLQHQD